MTDEALPDAARRVPEPRRRARPRLPGPDGRRHQRPHRHRHAQADHRRLPDVGAADGPAPASWSPWPAARAHRSSTATTPPSGAPSACFPSTTPENAGPRLAERQLYTFLPPGLAMSINNVAVLAQALETTESRPEGPVSSSGWPWRAFRIGPGTAALRLPERGCSGAGALRGLQNRPWGAAEASQVGSIPIHPRQCFVPETSWSGRHAAGAAVLKPSCIRPPLLIRREDLTEPIGIARSTTGATDEAYKEAIGFTTLAKGSQTADEAARGDKGNVSNAWVHRSSSTRPITASKSFVHGGSAMGCIGRILVGAPLSGSSKGLGRKRNSHLLVTAHMHAARMSNCS